MQGLLTPSTEAACPCCEEGPPPPHAHTHVPGAGALGCEGGGRWDRTQSRTRGNQLVGPAFPGP